MLPRRGKEGDRDRLIRVWKFLTFLYCLNGENKYAFAGLQEGPGTRISRDLHLEHHNKIAKEEIRAMGVQNINDKSVEGVRGINRENNNWNTL